MKYSNLLALLCIPAMLCACQKEQNDQQEEADAPKASEIQLSYLKHSLLYTDEQGEISLLRGVALDAADPTNVSLSVEDLEDAEYKFHELFYEDTPYSDLSATYTLDDNCGTAQLFVNDTPVDGVVAYAEFDIPEIPQITRLNYVLESSWPENAAARGYYKKGSTYQLEPWDADNYDWFVSSRNKKEWFVCLREDKDGNPALLVAITDAEYDFSYSWNWRNAGFYKRVPGMNRAEGIQKLISAEWENYCNIYNSKVPGALTENQYYWTDEGSDKVFKSYRYTIKLFTGEPEKLEVQNHDPKRRALFFFELPTPKKTFI